MSENLSTAPECLSSSSSSSSEITARLLGRWSAGERWLRVGNDNVWAHVWFNFDDEGTVTMTLRSDEQANLKRVLGRWWEVDHELCVGFGEGVIQAPVEFAEDVFLWAGTILARQP